MLSVSVFTLLWSGLSYVLFSLWIKCFLSLTFSNFRWNKNTVLPHVHWNINILQCECMLSLLDIWSGLTASHVRTEQPKLWTRQLHSHYSKAYCRQFKKVRYTNLNIIVYSKSECLNGDWCSVDISEASDSVKYGKLLCNISQYSSNRGFRGFSIVFPHM